MVGTEDEPRHRGKAGMALSDRVRLQISELIHNRVLSGGHAITEQRLAEELGVSRTPLREALQRLEGEGLVAKASNRSFVVRKVDFEEYIQSLKVRQMLEPVAAAAAAERAPAPLIAEVVREIDALRQETGGHTKAHWHSDDRLHGLISAHCGNHVLHEIISGLRLTTRLYEIADVRQRVEMDHEQHAAIAKALAERDGATARKAMQAHLRSLIAYSLSNVA